MPRAPVSNEGQIRNRYAVCQNTESCYNKSMQLQHILSAGQFRNVKVLDEIFRLAERMEHGDNTGFLPKPLEGKILASLFYEPSTRTRFSFETAITKLGGNIISTESASHFSSVTKGETLEDTIKIISSYADVIVLRHHVKGAAKTAARVSRVPIINAGDGSGEHPTQALLDIYTIQKELGRVDGKSIALVGDLLYGRTVHSLLSFLSMFKKCTLYLVSPQSLRLPKSYTDYLKKQKIVFKEISDINKILGVVDALYITRVQKERFQSQKDYESVKNSYIINRASLKKMKRSAIIMHPLPRVGEIAPEVDSDPRAIYFKQAKNGLYIRMALLHLIFNGHKVK